MAGFLAAFSVSILSNPILLSARLCASLSSGRLPGFGGRAERALICPFMGANALTTVHILALPLLSLG